MATDFSEYAGQAVAIVLAGTVCLEHESFGYNNILVGAEAISARSICGANLVRSTLVIRRQSCPVMIVLT